MKDTIGSYRPVTEGAAVSHVACPKCQADGRDDAWVHPARVEVDRLGDVIEVGPDGVGFLDRMRSKRENRGTVTTLDFWCEAGHQFRWTMQFHKGVTWFWFDQLEDYDGFLDELPRD